MPLMMKRHFSFFCSSQGGIFMKTKKLSNNVRRGVTGTLAVVLAATAMGPLFSVLSHATDSFDYIEELKAIRSGSSFNVIELVPQGKQTAMGYLAAGNEPLDSYSYDAATVEGWKKADRASYMSDVYSDLSTKGIIGTTVNDPVKNDGGYKEYFPWQVTELDEGIYANDDITAGVPNAGAKALKEMELTTEDSASVKGRFEGVEEPGTGDYKMNASYSISQKKFFYNEFYSKFGYSQGLWQTNTKLINYVSGDNLNLNTAEKTISVSSGGVAHAFPLSTTYASNKGYIMEVERNTEYELSFHADVSSGGKFYLAAYETSAGSLASLTGSDTLYPSKLYETSTDTSINESQSGNYKIIIKTSQMTGLTKKLYLQLCFGVDKTKNTTATFSNIYFGEPRGFEQDIDRFVYENAGYTDSEYDYWYDLAFTPISESDWETMDFEGVGIYEQGEVISGVTTYNCIGVAGVDDAEELDIDYDKAMNGGYYTARIKAEIYDAEGKGLQTVTETRDQYHPYRAVPRFEDGTSNLAFKPVDKGYFKALDKTYTYVKEGGDYTFIPDSSASNSIIVYTKKAYFANYVTGNDLFKYGALDYVDGTDSFIVSLTKLTPEATRESDYYLDIVKTTDMIVISAGTSTSANSDLDKVKFSEDITEEMKEAILEAASSTYKVPVVVDARLVNSTYANAISQTECPNLYALVTELLDKATENGDVSIKTGGVSANIYAFNPANIGGTAASFATKEFKKTIAASSDTSPYYDVYYQIAYENRLRVQTNYLPNSDVNEASCLRCIINYKGRRVMTNIQNLRVLDIEPYTNDPKQSYYYPKSQKTVANASYIDEYIIGSQWLPDKYFTAKNGTDKVTITEANAKDYITLTRMSTAELNGTGAQIIENYDIVYVGSAVGNLEKQMTNKNNRNYVAYNDDSKYFQNKLYSGIGDTYTVGNINYDGSNLGDMISGAVEGNTLAGLLNSDYSSITGKNSSFATWYISPNHNFGLRTTGNDITRDVMDQLKEFAAAGFPVIFADDLVTSGGIRTEFSVEVTAKEVYRGTTGYDHWGKNTSVGGLSFKTNDPGSGSGAVYFAFVKAEVIGDIPLGIKPVFNWKWKKGPTVQGSKNEGWGDFYRTKSEAEQNGKNKDWVEPIADEHILTEDQTAQNWYSTIGDWNYLGDYQNQNEKFENENKQDHYITGISLNKSDCPYQKLNQDYRYYCEVTFVEDNSTGKASPAVIQAFVGSGLTLHSNEISYYNDWNSYKNAFNSYPGNSDKTIPTDSPEPTSKTFNLSGKRNGKDHVLTLTMNPNPYQYNVYIDRGSFNFRHSAKLTPDIYSDCKHNNGVHGNVYESADKNKLYFEKDKCDYNNLIIEGDINGDHEWIKARGTDYTYNQNWNATITNHYIVPDTSWVRGATNNSTGAVVVSQKGYEKVSDYTVDNTSFLYQFMESVYNKVDYNAAEEAQGKVDKMPMPNIFIKSDFDETDGKNRLKQQLDSVQTPKLAVDKSVLVSYPAALPDRNLDINFVVYNDKNATGKQYEVHLYIDGNHDAVFSDYEETEPTYLSAKGGGAPAVHSGKKYFVTSSATTGSYNEYTLQKVLPSSYVGIIPWKLVVVDAATNKHMLHDSYIGYAYRKAGVGEGTIIKAIQILPADHWSNTVSKRYNAVSQLIADYDDPVIRGIWRPMYDTSHVNVSQAPFDSATLAAANSGNAYKGSIFLGTGAGRDGTIYKDDPDIDGDHVNEAWYLRNSSTAKDISKKSNLIYTYNNADFKNDAFYQLCLGADSKLDRTVYYEDLKAEIDVDSGDDSQYQLDLKEKLQEQFSQFSKDKINYRTHVEFWVNPKGSKVPKTDSHGNVVTDYFGNTVYAYEQYDFELDIALTDIYEMDFCWYQDMEDVNDDMDFLAQYDMLIMGFGDSYGKDTRQNRAGINLAAATLGFNQYAAMGIRKYVDSGRPVLFCHDTTNGNVNFIDYYALNAVSWIANVADKVEEFWNTTVKETATKIWYWIRNAVRSFIGMQTLEVPKPSIEQEDELNNKIADNRTRDGYFNNLILRYPLKLDRYGITYTICQQMDAKNAWSSSNFRLGHAYTYILGNTAYAEQRNEDGDLILDEEDNPTYVTENYNSFEYPSSGSGSVNEIEMLAHGFTVAYEPGSARKTTLNARKDQAVQYTHYDGTENGGTKIVDGVTVDAKFEGDQVKADYIYDTQGFTKWTIARYISNEIINDRSLANSYYMPISVPGNINTAHRGVYMTSAITQVGSGSITTYPYDVNTSKFGGTTGNEEDGKIRIMPTHDQYYQINLNDGDTTVWYCLADPSGTSDSNKCYDLLPNDCANSYYIYTSGNVTYTGAGHANIFTEEEAKLFLNTLVGAYRAAKEKPEVYFRDAKDTQNIEYQVLTANDRKNSTGVDDTFVDREVTGVKIVNPNITNGVEGDLVVNFYSDAELKHKVENVTLYTVNDNGTLKGESVTSGGNGYSVTTDRIYFFYTPQEVLNALKDSESYVIYAQSAVNGQASEVVRLEYRRLGLANLT